MPRTLSSALITSKNTLSTGPPWGFLLELDIDGAPASLYYTTDVVTTTFQGQAYTPLPMEISLPENAIGELQRMQLTVSNVGQQFQALVETYWISGNADWTINVWQIDLTQPDETPLGVNESFTVLGMTTDLLHVVADCQASGVTLSRRVPGRSFTATGGFAAIPRR